jgi:NAD(P)-dependent dehydrogenase (short-subunit alcohol dehydrogenase family)
MSASIDLKGQVVVVTGGGRGLGQAIARGLAAAGASVAVAARSEDELQETVTAIEQSGGRAIAITTDVTDWRAVEHMAQVTEQQLGPIDLLVNNAGVIGAFGPTWEVDPDEWWQILDVNVRGVLLCTRAILPGMVRRRRGRIINVSSGAGRFAIPYASAYVASKTALIRLTESLAVEAKEHQIAAFALDPGTVRTAMSQYILEDPLGQKWAPWFAEIFKEGRDSPAEASADLVLFLASGQADALSGCFFHIRDNMPELVGRAEQIQQNQRYTLRVNTE